MYVPQGEIPIYVGDAACHWICEDTVLTLRSNTLVVASGWPQQSLSTKISTPKGGGSFSMASLTNRSHQVNSRSLCAPCFVSCVYDETGWLLLNLHLSYKPPSYWRILFRSGGWPRQLNCLKKFRDLVVPGGGFHKGIIIQGSMAPTGVLPNGHSCFIKRGM